MKFALALIVAAPIAAAIGFALAIACWQLVILAALA